MDYDLTSGTNKEEYINQAENLLRYSKIVTFISLLSYVIPLLAGFFDFGLILESITFISLFVASNSLIDKNMNLCKKFTIIALLPLAFLLIYDIFTILIIKPYIY